MVSLRLWIVSWAHNFNNVGPWFSDPRGWNERNHFKWDNLIIVFEIGRLKTHSLSLLWDIHVFFSTIYLATPPILITGIFKETKSNLEHALPVSISNQQRVPHHGVRNRRSQLRLGRCRVKSPSQVTYLVKSHGFWALNALNSYFSYWKTYGSSQGCFALIIEDRNNIC